MRTSPAFAFAVAAILCSSPIARLDAADAVSEPAASAPKTATTVKINAAERRPDINPFIYAQFIEHLGRCIYGGIWAEMLEDRKFYFPITENYAPYKSLEKTEFPVVGASPWQIIGSADGVAMTKEKPFVGEQTPQIAAGHGIRQRDLGVVQGKKYIGYAWLKSAGDKPAAVEVVLKTSDDAKPTAHKIAKLTGDYQKYPFEFTADATTDHANLELNAVGEGNVLVGTISLMPADNVKGMRADTLALLKELDAPMYRWPGGNFVSGYDWRDGIGDRDRRPPRKNPAWTGVEHNDVGLDEFLVFCQEVGAEPLIAVNTGFGDDYSAAQEVDYCNGAADTIGGEWRVKNGRVEPYGVKYWCVGNEMFGNWQLGYMALPQYAQKHNLVAKAMLKADPTIELIGVGNFDPKDNAKWSEGMLKDCHEHMDYISEHFYRGRTPWGEKTPDDVAQHVAMLKEEVKKKADGHRDIQKRQGLLPDRTIPIVMDEWNYWHNDYVYGELGCAYDLADALGVAAGLHEFFRNTDIIRMAHYAQTVNVIGCIKTTKTDAFLDTTAYPLMLYRKHFGTQPVAVDYEAGEQNLDVAAALSEDGKTLAIGVVNPSNKPAQLKFDVADLKPSQAATQWIVAGKDPRATNDADNDRIKDVQSDVEFDGNWEVPGFAFGILSIPLQ
ncbi:alpha-L-arabinofuranosidase C-terminal domain-containing protein [Lacipirellula parvula]|uniref:non-reducing end alpha-L-arabinofuranosidase n=1 Tax=Lacipirellula parvula TaxID=2650471 RepID=A0A5K7X3U3_9BACT|nr:alpha-L-arabinofuranosidase C-terminal domain-containing protein [Lacipirellula parvula]BBO31190.1 alpha-L-arabinofuranosidase [Lacipirellula parvula]